MNFKQILPVSVALALTLPATFAAAATISDNHVTDLNVANDTYVGGGAGLLINGLSVGVSHYSYVNMSCGALTGATVVSTSGTAASYGADCGDFDVVVTVRLLSPLPSLAANSAGWETEMVFTNTSGMLLPLTVIQYLDPDLGGIANDEITGRDAASGAVYNLEQLSDPDMLLSTIATTDNATAILGWDADFLGSVSNSFPMDNGSGPIGPTDVGQAIGFEMEVGAGASSTVRFRSMYAHGVTTVPADFDMSSCYTTPVVGCRNAQKGSLSLNDNADDSKDKLQWKFLNGDATTQDDFGDPASQGDFTLCLYDAASEQWASAHVAASAVNWAPTGDTGYKFKDATGGNDGIVKSVLKGGADGKSKLIVGGKGASLPDPTLGAIGTPVRAQFHSGGNAGACWESTLGTVIKNDAQQFKVSTP